jgi:hypothetical protein
MGAQLPVDSVLSIAWKPCSASRGIRISITGKSKGSLRMRRKVAALDDNALAAYIAV